MPDEPENIQIDPLVNGLVAGVIGYLFGHSRRGAHIAGTVGVLLSTVANAIYVWSLGVDQPLVLGGAGAFDVVVISGLLAVTLQRTARRNYGAAGTRPCAPHARIQKRRIR